MATKRSRAGCAGRSRSGSCARATGHTAAAQRFLGLTLGAVFAGFLVALLLQLTGMSEQIANRLAVIPGSLAQVLAAVATTLPWILLVLCGVAPMLIVRKQRRIRERRMHVELPVLLDLMATLTAAGLGFDTALERYLQAADPSSPLVQEWRQFQREIAAGQARVAALRAVATRCHVIPVSTAVSALVQAEVQGSSIANILAQQAEDARLRRRDQVLLLAQALPVKLVFPLMICFLPGIFIVTLGPALLEFVRMADQIIRNTAR